VFVGTLLGYVNLIVLVIAAPARRFSVDSDNVVIAVALASSVVCVEA
jgi:hypothetical protein